MKQPPVLTVDRGDMGKAQADLNLPLKVPYYTQIQMFIFHPGLM